MGNWWIRRRGANDSGDDDKSVPAVVIGEAEQGGRNLGSRARNGHVGAGGEDGGAAAVGGGGAERAGGCDIGDTVSRREGKENSKD